MVNLTCPKGDIAAQPAKHEPGNIQSMNKKQTADILNGLSNNLEKNVREKLASVFPECFAEGKLDIDKLLALCGEYAFKDFEKYEFTWKGKSKCLALARHHSMATLRPCP